MRKKLFGQTARTLLLLVVTVLAMVLPARSALAADDDMAFGTWGTYPWEISADGVLTIHPGVGVDRSGWSANSAWVDYSDDIAQEQFEQQEPDETAVTEASGEALVLDADQELEPEPDQATLPDTSEPDALANDSESAGSDHPASRGNIASGTWGTCDWVITSEGALIVYDGEGASQKGRTSSPWSGYASYITSVDFGGYGVTYAPEDSSYLFAGLYNATTIDVSNLYTLGVTNMEGMFARCSDLTTLIDNGQWITANVTNMRRMFSGCSSLTEFEFTVGSEGNWSTDNVTDMSEMFSGCYSLASIDLTRIHVSHLKNVSGMFSGCHSLESLVFPFFWNDAYIEDMSYMFDDCSSLIWLDLTELRASSLVDTSYMFRDCHNLTTVYIVGFWHLVDESEGMFEGCYSIVGGRGTAYDPDHVDALYANLDSEVSRGYLWELVRGNSQEDDIASGRWGSCPWEISANGTLTVHPGVGGSAHSRSWEDSYWDEYKDDITAVVFGDEDDYQGVIAPKDSSRLFCGFENLTSVDASRLIVSRTEDMSRMFYDCPSLSSLDLSGWDTSSVTDMSELFSWCSSLTSIDLSHLDTSQVTYMSEMFHGCSSLTSIDLSSLNTSSVTGMSGMFSSCSSLTTIDLSSLDTSSVVDMSGMFSWCSSLTSIDLSNIDTSSVLDMSSMFALCSSLASIDLSHLDTSSVVDMSGMFSSCSSLASADVSGIDTSSVVDMRRMFFGCSKLSSLDLSGWDTSLVTDMSDMFYNCHSLSSIDLSSFDTSSVEDMSGMFDSCSSLDSIDVSAFDTSSVRDMSNMFSKCSSIRELDVSGWDTSSVCSMSNLFYGCSSLASLDVSGWDTSLVENMAGTFDGCSSLTELDVSGWDTSSVTDMNHLFSGCSLLAELDVSGWDTSSVTDMQWLFCGCSALSTIDVSKWDTSLVKDMNSMFSDCSSVRSLDVSGWDTSNVTDMASMFGGCPSLSSLDVSAFDTSKVTNMGWMFGECSSLTSIDLASFDTSSVTRMSNMFRECSSLTELDLSSFDTSSVRNIDKMFSGCSSLEVIYAGDRWTTASITYSQSIFDGCEALVGGCGTPYDANHDYYAYAHIDTDENPGYLTAVGQKIDISRALLEEVPDQVWTGLAITPAVTLELKGRELTEGKEYTVSYEDNVDCGIATITVTGIGRYTGTKTSTFQIVSEGTVPYGTWGTCPWNISNGVLTVHPGVGASQAGRDLSPWDANSADITSVVFAEEGGRKVVLPEDCSYLLAYLGNVVTVDTSGLDVSAVKNMQCMFYYCSSLASVDVSGWDTSGVTSIRAMFSQCYALDGLDVSGWDTSNVTSMRATFHTCSSLGELDVSGWDTSSVTSMYCMFYGCSLLDEIDVSCWDTSRVADMYAAFYWCSSLASLDVSGWDTSSVTNMGWLFGSCSSLASLDVSKWDTSSVTALPGIFYNCSLLSSLDLSSWDTSGVTDMNYMFYGCTNLATIYAGDGWSTASVTESGSMFSGCMSLVGGSGTAYDADHVDAEYARVDASGAPGYLTAKSAGLIDLSGAVISAPAAEYTGQAIEPELRVLLGGRELVEGVDYVVTSCEDNVMPGTATVAVSGVGAYSGTATGSFVVDWPFTDVSAKTSHWEDILWLFTSGITKGWGSYPSRTFRGTNGVQRGDMAAFLYRLAGSPDYEPTPEELAYFSDVHGPDANGKGATPHYREICWLASTGISKGWTMKDGTHEFRPSNTVVRQDMAAFLYRLAGSPAYEPTAEDLAYFSDVHGPDANGKGATPHYKEICWLASTGVTRGWTVGSTHEFRGTKTVVRQDMAAFLHRMDAGGYVPECQ